MWTLVIHKPEFSLWSKAFLAAVGINGLIAEVCYCYLPILRSCARGRATEECCNIRSIRWQKVTYRMVRGERQGYS